MAAKECKSCEELTIIHGPTHGMLCSECIPDLERLKSDLRHTIDGYTEIGLRRIIICQRMIRALDAIEKLQKRITSS